METTQEAMAVSTKKKALTQEESLKEIIKLAESKLKTWQDIAAEMGVYFAYLSEIKHGKKPGIKTYKKMLAWYEKNKH